ncbi:hypothetical protein M2171_004940 [Bradyrhizobium japonicum USDA 38]|uniref:hypothetical protein n=1 Tax=Bradyrhizobium japonicum TaxID=375 RepID=UPI00042774FD|nr:hypothetical protein [Bradyrhizobium japonicum]MCS3895807.1 hypothetical protein [Bradyrhizobium japonicum USDA 38]MCS3948322.1 hypothetical protein [Bradyrhizobium japonicum]
MTEQPLIPETPALPSTPAEAATRLDQLKADPKWASSFVSGSPSHLQEFRDLHEIVAKGDHVDMAMSGLMPEMPSSSHREMAGTASMLRELGIDDRIIKETLTGHMVTKPEYEATERWKKDAMSNPDFVKRYIGGDNEARRKMTLANIILTGGIQDPT